MISGWSPDGVGVQGGSAVSGAAGGNMGSAWCCSSRFGSVMIDSDRFGSDRFLFGSDWFSSDPFGSVLFGSIFMVEVYTPAIDIDGGWRNTLVARGVDGA